MAMGAMLGALQPLMNSIKLKRAISDFIGEIIARLWRLEIGWRLLNVATSLSFIV